MKILLLCSAGMSTSFLVKRMREAARCRNLDIELWASGNTDSEEEIQKADVILVGPQMRFLVKKIQEIAQKRPVRVIDMVTYGRMDGEHALDLALAAWEKAQLKEREA